MTKLEKIIADLDALIDYWVADDGVHDDIFNGVSMLKTLDEARDALELLKDDETQLQYRSDIIYEEERETARLRKLLKEQEPRVLTLEEVIHSGNDMMWLEIKCAKPLHFMLVPTSPYTDNDERWLSVSFQSGHVQSKGLYGRQWRCWNTRPTDEQRKAVKWNEA